MRSKIEVKGAETDAGPLSDDALALLRTTDGKAAIASLLLRQGRLDDALLLFQDVVAEAPWHREAHVSIAAILADRGEESRAWELLSGFFARFPLSDAEEPSTTRPKVLRVRGFDATRIMLAYGDDGFKPRFRGGHFTTKFLLDTSGLALRTFTISRDNILRPGAMPDHDLILNTIAEPDIEGRSLNALANWLDANPETPVINRPERVRETARDINWQRLQGFEGVRFPRTVRVSMVAARRAELADELRKIGFEHPFILRKAGTQTARTTVLVETVDDLDRYAQQGAEGDHFAIAYHPILWRGEFFRKLRLFHIDGAFYPVVCHLDRHWNVHGNNRKEVMRPRPDLIAEEKRFLDDWQSYVGGKNTRRLEHLAAFVGLEFFGIDFTLDEDGQIFIYELNAAMRHSFDHSENFPYKLPHDQAITAAFTGMVDRRLRARIRTAP